MKRKRQLTAEVAEITLNLVDPIMTNSGVRVMQYKNTVTLDRYHPDPADPEGGESEEIKITPEDIPVLIAHFISLLPARKLRRVK